MAARSSLGQITRSRVAVTLLMVAGGFMVLGNVLVGLAYVLLHLSTLSTSENLLRAGTWLEVAATASGLVAVCAAGWRLVVRPDWRSIVEFAAAALSSLLVFIGFLVAALALPSNSRAAWIVAATGLGGWMLLALANAARRSFQEQTAPVGRQSDLWLAAAVGLLALAVATALPSPSRTGNTLAIAQNAVFALAWIVLALSVDLGRQRRHLGGRAGATLVAGLVVLAAGSVAGAVAWGFVFTSSATLTTLRIGLSLTNFVHALGWTVVAFAALQRLVELKEGVGAEPRAFMDDRYAPGPIATEPFTSRPARPGAAQRLAPCEHCGDPLPSGAAFCPRCGQPVEQRQARDPLRQPEGSQGSPPRGDA